MSVAATTADTTTTTTTAAAAPLPYASFAIADDAAAAASARRPRPLLCGMVLGAIALGLTAAACVLLAEARPIVTGPPPPVLSPWVSARERDLAYQSHAAAMVWTPARTAHVIVLYTASAGCLTAAALVLRQAVRKLMSA